MAPLLAATDKKLCTHCGEAKARIVEDEARVLEFIPARFELHIHILPSPKRLNRANSAAGMSEESPFFK
jgi:hypothetical protein